MWESFLQVFLMVILCSGFETAWPHQLAGEDHIAPSLSFQRLNVWQTLNKASFCSPTGRSKRPLESLALWNINGTFAAHDWSPQLGILTGFLGIFWHFSVFCLGGTGIWFEVLKVKVTAVSFSASSRSVFWEVERRLEQGQIFDAAAVSYFLEVCGGFCVFEALMKLTSDVWFVWLILLLSH